MLNGNNTGMVQYKTVKVATLDSIIQIVFSHTRCPHLMLAQGHKVSLAGCGWRRCTLFILFADKEETQCVLLSHNPHDFLVFSPN